MFISCLIEDPPVGGTDVDIQLLEAAKAGDLEVVKVILSFIHANDYEMNM